MTSTSCSVISYAQCSMACRITGDTDWSSKRLLACTHFLHRLVFHRPLAPATPVHREICRACPPSASREKPAVPLKPPARVLVDDPPVLLPERLACPAFTCTRSAAEHRRARCASGGKPANQCFGNSACVTATSLPLMPALPPRGLKYTPPQLPAWITCLGVRFGAKLGWSLKTRAPVRLSRSSPSSVSSDGAKGTAGAAFGA